MSASIGSANVSMGMFANTGSSCPRVAGGHQETDIALKIGVGRVDRRQRIGHQRRQVRRAVGPGADHAVVVGAEKDARWRSEEHTSELQSLMRNSYAVFCLKNKKKKNINIQRY